MESQFRVQYHGTTYVRGRIHSIYGFQFYSSATNSKTEIKFSIKFCTIQDFVHCYCLMNAEYILIIS